jgi:dienelactone hydrolase
MEHPTASPAAPSTDGYARTDIDFRSGGRTLRGWHYVPEGAAAGPRPGIVMAEGFAGVKEISLDLFARPLAEAGFHVVGFDYPYFGASDGTPRQRLDPRAQVRGYRDALRWLATQPNVDAARLGVWGASFAGGHVLTLCAGEPLVRFGVAIVPFLGTTPRDAVRRTVRALLGKPSALVHRMPVVASDPKAVAMMPNAEAYRTLTGIAAERAPAFENFITADSLLRIAPYRPGRAARTIAVPCQLVSLSEDTITPPAPIRQLAEAIGPAAELHELEGSHFEMFGAHLTQLRSLTVEFCLKQT